MGVTRVIIYQSPKMTRVIPETLYKEDAFSFVLELEGREGLLKHTSRSRTLRGMGWFQTPASNDGTVQVCWIATNRVVNPVPCLRR